MADAGSTLSVKGLIDLADRLSEIDLTGDGPPPVPWGSKPTVDAFGTAIDSGVGDLPLSYVNDYVTPLRASLARVLSGTQYSGGTDPAETLLGAVYDHSQTSGVRAPLRRFLYIVADLYDSFHDKEDRARLNIPLATLQPPLATFRSNGDNGPYTYTSDVVKSITGSEVGVVSLPSTYREHPLTWGSLAHETGGHDVVHADPGLLAEASAGAMALFTAQTATFGTYAPVIGALWSNWIDETMADIYGTLNLGPEFALNFIPWLMAFRARGDDGPPMLMTDAGQDAGGVIDRHPPDQLRIDLAIGTIQSLRGLNALTAAAYINLLQNTEQATTKSAVVNVDGILPLPNGTQQPINVAIPLPLMRLSARMMGAYIATAPFTSLSNHSIQDIETWDDPDETTAQRIAAAMLAGSITGITGDAAQIMAGATLAAVAEPSKYDELTPLLDALLDAGVMRDPIWGVPQPHMSSIWSSLPAAGAPAAAEAAAPRRFRRGKKRRVTTP